MQEYEVIREIFNLCPGNQMRDIFIEEIELPEQADLEAYVKENGRFPILESTRNESGDVVIVTGDNQGSFVRYTFTE